MHRLLLLLTSTIYLAAQAPPDTAYSVAYVDVLPSSRAAAIAAVKQYRDASRQDGGFERIELFEQAARTAHFCILETWANAKDLDTHAGSSHARDFRARIDSMRLSDYDQRPYKTLSLSAAHSGSSQGPFVITHVDIGGQGGNAAELLRTLADASRKEEGNLRFDVLQHAMRANHFTVIEEWRTAKALDAHAAATHTKEFRNRLGPIAGSPLDERVYKAVD